MSRSLALGARGRQLFGALVGFSVWVWTRTLRVTVVADEGSEGSGPRVLTFCHGQQMALVAARHLRRTAVLVSHSRDGDIQAGVMGFLSFHVIRGSSSVGGARALRALVRLVRSGLDAALSVDGPRGPALVAKPGALALARLSGAALVPVASAASSKIVLHGTWDAFEIPLPFSRVAIVLGAPLKEGEPHDARALGCALLAARVRAAALVLRREAGHGEASCRTASP